MDIPDLQGRMLALGFAFVLIGFALVFLSALVFVLNGGFPGAKPVESKEVKIAFFGFLGPIPFGIGNDPGLLRLAMFLSLFLLLLFLASYKKLI